MEHRRIPLQARRVGRVERCHGIGEGGCVAGGVIPTYVWKYRWRRVRYCEYCAKTFDEARLREVKATYRKMTNDDIWRVVAMTIVMGVPLLTLVYEILQWWERIR